MSSPQAARRLARKTYSLQLPLQLASRLEALSEMYPAKPQAELLVDLLGLGLAQLEQHWPQAGTRAAADPFHPDQRPPVYLLTASILNSSGYLF